MMEKKSYFMEPGSLVLKVFTQSSQNPLSVLYQPSRRLKQKSFLLLHKLILYSKRDLSFDFKNNFIRKVCCLNI